MKNGIRNTLAWKRGIFLCLSLLACGSISGTFTNTIPAQRPDAVQVDTHPPSGETRISASAVKTPSTILAAHKQSSSAATLPSFTNTSSGDGSDTDSRTARSRASMPAMSIAFANSVHLDTSQTSGSQDQSDDNAGDYAPGGAYGGNFGGYAGGTISNPPGNAAGGTTTGTFVGLGAPSASGPGNSGSGGCLASSSSTTTLPLGAGYCFVADSGTSGGQDPIIAQANADPQPPTIRQTISQRPGGGSNPDSGNTPASAGAPSVPNSPPNAPSGSPPNLPPPPVGNDITPFVPNPIIQLNIVGSNLPSFTPLADPPAPTSVPEPATLGLVFLGMAGLIVARRRKMAKGVSA